MDKITRMDLDNLRSEERELQNKAFFSVIEAKNKPVDWAYDAWDEMVTSLSHKDNHSEGDCGLSPQQSSQERSREQDAQGF